MDRLRARNLRVPPLLVSFHYLMKGGTFAKMVQRFWGCGQVTILVDSGAFSSHRLGTKIRLTTYIEACKEYLSHDETWGCIQLDVIGEKNQSRRNLDRMVKAGVKPMPVVTVDAPTSVAAEYAQINKRMCVAGGLGFCATPICKALGHGNWLRDRYIAVSEAAGEGSELHGLGFVWFPDMLEVPLASVDSSSHSAGERFGVLAAFGRGKGMQTLGRLKSHRVAGWKNMDARYRDHLDRCGVTQRDWNDDNLMRFGPGSFSSCCGTAASAHQMLYGLRHDRLIFQACTNWLCWTRLLLTIKYGNDDSSFDFWKVRKDLYHFRTLPQGVRNDAIVDLMTELNQGASHGSSSRLLVG